MISAVFIQTGPVVTNMVTNLDGTITVMTSQAMAMSVNFLWVVQGIVAIGWLAWFLGLRRAVDPEEKRDEGENQIAWPGRIGKGLMSRCM